MAVSACKAQKSGLLSALNGVLLLQANQDTFF
jgi:hypothetical protein